MAVLACGSSRNDQVALFDLLGFQRSACAQTDDGRRADVNQFLEADSSAWTANSVADTGHLYTLESDVVDAVLAVPLDLLSVVAEGRDKFAAEWVAYRDNDGPDNSDTNLKMRGDILCLLLDINLLNLFEGSRAAIQLGHE